MYFIGQKYVFEAENVKKIVGLFKFFQSLNIVKYILRLEKRAYLFRVQVNQMYVEYNNIISIKKAV